MVTNHESVGKPLDGDATPNGKDTDANILHNYHYEGMDNFENVEQGKSHQPGNPYSGIR